MDGHIKVVKLLINDGRIDPSAYNNSAIKKAIYRNDKNVVSILIKDGGVVVNDSIIKFASLEGSDSMVKYLFNFK
uniref:Ankyrin repeat protein n=1 Tax=Pithovirus LCPAC001 TaxID=2506585 RepID=A0A481Z1X5_9VIRU|nr:MAG: ankyrin repeat protein [Pithovirus LCPAC001]